MADKTRFPQIPSTVWWGVHAMLNRTPNATLDERFLSVHLKVQSAAAKAYIAELVSVGILNQESKATPLALKWRLPGTYGEAVNEIISSVYPQGLIDLAPPDEGDRQKAISWFMHEGLGQGAAGNKASTYFMIGSKTPNEAPGLTAGARRNRDDKPQKVRMSMPQAETKTNRSGGTKAAAPSNNPTFKGDGIPLNVNVQIHISADATSDQIESIFSAKRRYLYDKQDF